MPKLLWALICKQAPYNEAGELVMVKPFIEVSFDTGFPTPKYPFHVISCWGGVDGEAFTFFEKLIAPDGNIVTSEPETYEIKNGFATINSPYNLPLPSVGEYRIEFHIDDFKEPIGSIYLTAVMRTSS